MDLTDDGIVNMVGGRKVTFTIHSNLNLLEMIACLSTANTFVVIIVDTQNNFAVGMWPFSFQSSSLSSPV
jgi:hypothetical protein